jgi:hypothetical protein
MLVVKDIQLRQNKFNDFRNSKGHIYLYQWKNNERSVLLFFHPN